MGQIQMACMANHVDVYPFQSRDVFNLNTYIFIYINL